MTDREPTGGQGDEPLAASSAESALDRSSAAFLATLEQLDAMERRKGAMGPDDPERPDLARRIEDVAAVLLGRSAYQRRLADEAFDQVDGGEARHPAVVLEDWRDAEHRLIEGRSIVQRALDDAERFREEYRISFMQARDRERRDAGD